MDLRINKEPVRSGERICCCAQEQPIELDYVLPDYYPEIFRIIKCCTEAEITACSVSGDKAVYELTVHLKIIYCPEDSKLPEAVEQKLVYSRTVSIEKAAENVCVYIKAVPDCVNCRAVNKRRIDVRGAVTVNICIMGESETEVISEAFGSSIQVRKKSLVCPVQSIRAQKRVLVSDDFTLSETAPSVGTILRASAEIISADKKIIAGKAAAKGELKISVVYTSREKTDSPVSSAQFSLPYSQLVELDGLNEDHLCHIDPSVISCTVIPRSDGDGSSRQLECEVMLFIDCLAVRMAEREIAVDEYSTAYASSHSGTEVRLEKQPETVESSFSVRGSCESRDSSFAEIYDAYCDASGLKASVEDGRLIASGNVVLTVMGETDNGDFTICESEVPVNEILAVSAQGIGSEADVRVNFSVISCSFNITSDNAAEIKADITARGRITDFSFEEALTEISVDEAAPREGQGDYALRLYFAESGEELWDIAKRYGASVDRIIEENELDGDSVNEAAMLLIPLS